MALCEATASFDSLFPRTRYFEMESVHTGTRHAVWVTVPMTYFVDPNRHFPAIYETDGNIAFPQSAPIDAMLYFDPIHPIRPFIKVSVGYVPAEAVHFTALRNRDLTPRNDPAGEMMLSALSELAAIHYISEDTAELGRHQQAGGADNLQAFLEKELHPALLEVFRIDAKSVALWGYSLGGLFASHVALKKSAVFKTIGAGSPAIVQTGSTIFALYHAQLEAKTDYVGQRFHVTVALNELTVPTYYQTLVGVGTAKLLALMGEKPLPGLRVTSEVITLDSHATAFQPSWFSFLRACYKAEQISDLSWEGEHHSKM